MVRLSLSGTVHVPAYNRDTSIPNMDTSIYNVDTFVMWMLCFVPLVSILRSFNSTGTCKYMYRLHVHALLSLCCIYMNLNLEILHALYMYLFADFL